MTAQENGELVKLVGQMLDEKLQPIRHDLSEIKCNLVEIRTLARNMAVVAKHKDK